jgi:hypothetical protein
VLGCNDKTQKNKSEFEVKIESVTPTIPTVRGNQTFSFFELSEDIWNWQKLQNLTEIDSSLWVSYINKPDPIGSYSTDYQKNYFYKMIDFDDACIYLITLQYIRNNNESYMYLLQFDKQGNRKKMLVLASIYKSPDEYEEVHSSIQGRNIITYRYYSEDSIIKRDTIVNSW